MSKITLTDLANLQNETTAVNAINNNNATLTAALDNTLSRDGTSPNTMGSTLDMNSHRIINLPTPISTTEPTTLGYMNSVLAGGNINSGLISGVPVSAAMQPVVNASTTLAAYNLLYPGITGTISDPGKVEMRYINGAWTTFIPGGTVLNTAGTTTNGLQESINYAANNGFSLKVTGHGATTFSQQTGTLNSSNIITGLNTTGMTSGMYVTGPGLSAGTQILTVDTSSQIHITTTASLSGPFALRFAVNLIFINCTTGITIPPVEQWSCKFENVNITFSTSVTGPCFQFDSCMIVNFEFVGGQIVGQPNPGGVNSYLVYFNPTNPVPLDGIITITGSRFIFSNTAFPASVSKAQSVFGFNIGLGSIDNSLFQILEANGTGIGTSPNTQYGILAFGAQPTTAFEQNIIDITDLHLTSSALVQIGVGAANQGNYRHNLWRLSGLRAAGISGAGINTFGSYDIFQVGGITNEEGNYNYGIIFEPGAVGNQAYVGQILGATLAPILDSGTNNSVFTGDLGSYIGSPTGGLKGAGTLNVSGNLYKNGTAYGNP